MENIFVEGWYLVLKENNIEVKFINNKQYVDEIIISQVYETFEEAEKVKNYIDLQSEDVKNYIDLETEDVKKDFLSIDAGCFNGQCNYECNGTTYVLTQNNCTGSGCSCYETVGSCTQADIGQTVNGSCYKLNCGTCGVICTGGMWYGSGTCVDVNPVDPSCECSSEVASLVGTACTQEGEVRNFDCGTPTTPTTPVSPSPSPSPAPSSPAAPPCECYGYCKYKCNGIKYILTEDSCSECIPLYYDKSRFCGCLQAELPCDANKIGHQILVSNCNNLSRKEESPCTGTCKYRCNTEIGTWNLVQDSCARKNIANSNLGCSCRENQGRSLGGVECVAPPTGAGPDVNNGMIIEVFDACGSIDLTKEDLCSCSALCKKRVNGNVMTQKWEVRGCRGEKGRGCGEYNCGLDYLDGRPCSDASENYIFYSTCYKSPLLVYPYPGTCGCTQHCIDGYWRTVKSNCGTGNCNEICQGTGRDTCGLLEDNTWRRVGCTSTDPTKCGGYCSYYWDFQRRQWFQSSSTCRGNDCICPEPGFDGSNQKYLSLPCLKIAPTLPAEVSPVAPDCAGDCTYICDKTSGMNEFISADGCSFDCACPKGGLCSDEDLASSKPQTFTRPCKLLKKDPVFNKTCGCTFKCTKLPKVSIPDPVTPRYPLVIFDYYWRLIKNQCALCDSNCGYEFLPKDMKCSEEDEEGEALFPCRSDWKDPQQDHGCEGCSVVCTDKGPNPGRDYYPYNRIMVYEKFLDCGNTDDPALACFCGIDGLVGTRCESAGKVISGNCVAKSIGCEPDYPAPIVLPNNEKRGTVKLSPIVDGIVTINAIPKDGYELAGWVGDMTGNSKETQLLIIEDMDITAVFNATPDLGKPKPKITFQVNLISENDFNSTLLSRVPKEGQTLSDFDMNINSRSISFPGVDATLKHGDIFVAYGKEAEQLKRTYDKGGPFDTLKVASIDWNA